MKNILNRYKVLKRQKQFYLEVLIALALFGISLFFNYVANSYTTSYTGAVASDLFLDHLPIWNIEGVFFEGMLALAGFMILLGLYKPNRIPFMLKASALFVVVRAFFLILTHLAPPPHAIALHASNILEKLVAGSGDDLFFSGHTGLPFLMALIFWHNKTLRIIFFAAALFYGGAVLLGHLHYSIDVFSAFFITYGIYRMALRLFKKDYQFFEAEI